MSNKLHTLTTNQILDDPRSVGLPTFDEFVKNPEILLGKEDEILQRVDVGTQNDRGNTKKITYEIYGYQCKTLHEVERVARNMGINLREIEYIPVKERGSAGKYEFKVIFMSKQDYDKRKAWR